MTRLVEVGGLKAVMPIFMGRAAARKLRKQVGALCSSKRFIVSLPVPGCVVHGVFSVC